MSASFYPYVGLTHTIRRQEGGWRIRVSDHCRDAPREVLEAISILLAARVLRRSEPRRFRRIYESYRRDPGVRERVRLGRLARGRKRIDSSDGRHHSLAEIYRDLNERYFNGQVQVRRLGWGTKPGWNRVGHFDPVHETITISPALDSPSVPRSVVQYLVYHEMLHAVFTAHPPPGARGHHPPAFREADRAFPGHASATKFLREFSRTRGKAIG